jgi:hypothetical protein
VICDLLWEALNNSVAVLDISFRHYMYLIYREFYYDFIPAFYVGETEDVDFEPDSTWIEVEEKDKKEKEIEKEKKFINLKWLSLQKRKRISEFNPVLRTLTSSD